MINVITVKHGTAYSADYVNRMRHMIARHLTLPHRFYCLTEDPRDLEQGIETRPLPDLALQGWWMKPYMFCTGLFPTGTNFYIDLDMVIYRNIDKFMTYLPNEFMGLRDLYHLKDELHAGLGSAIMRWPNNTYNFIWSRLERAPDLQRNYRGDQDYIWHYHKNTIRFYPETWTHSYKWQSRQEPHEDSSVLVFHGEPKPHQIPTDPRVLNNWI
jgi:hypothetical protein